MCCCKSGNGCVPSVRQSREWVCPQCQTKHDRDTNAAINLAQLGNNLPTRRGEVTSIDMAALALGNRSETAGEKSA
ncbi:MAG: transposase [Treponema sp.]|nr:transposase [Treponema sp.]